LTGPDSKIGQAMQSLGSMLFGNGKAGGAVVNEQLPVMPNLLGGNPLGTFGIGEQVSGMSSVLGGNPLEMLGGVINPNSKSGMPGLFNKITTGGNAVEEGASLLTSEMPNINLDFLNNLGTSMADGAAQMSDGITSAVSSAGGAGGAGGGMAGLAGMAGSIFGTLFATLFLAKGGSVDGPGTSTSDSIPAMLSKGEFVVNTAATRENFSLLKSINSGKFSMKKFAKFAQGGLVGDAVIALPPASTANLDPEVVPANSGITEINLGVTGDISKQTKKTIYEMLPHIAEGVNAHNREKGYK
jgi:hypothetical protein